MNVLNLFSNLHRWLHRQDENYVTELFAYLLRHLMESEVELARSFLAWFCSTAKAPFEVGQEMPRLRTQKRRVQGQPDMDFRWTDAAVLVEVKKESPVDEDQLRRYLELLNEAPEPRKRLILLTMLPYSGHFGGDDTVKPVRWYEVAHRFRQWLSQNQLENGVSEYLVRQFLDFLDDQRMTIRQVTNEYISGTKMFLNLIDLLERAIRESPSKIPIHTNKPVGGKNFWGFYLGLPNQPKAFFVGIDLDELDIIKFEFEDAAFQQSLKTVAGWEVEGKEARKYFSIDEDFFGLPVQGQSEALTAFVESAYQDALAHKA